MDIIYEWQSLQCLPVALNSCDVLAIDAKPPPQLVLYDDLGAIQEV